MLAEILSPIDSISPTKLVRTISTKKVIEIYKNGFNIDVSRFFKSDLKEIEVRECLSTGYQFYYPFGIDGDGKFYEALEKYPWYYEPWKWEYDYTIQGLSKDHKILEVGTGGNVFIKKLNDIGYTNLTGLELNENSVTKGQREGLNIIAESIQDHAKRYPNHYDVVTSFQVVEHIANVSSFIQSSIDTLKPGGQFIISVPNNASYLGLKKDASLNLPPHHMGLWTPDALRNIANHFNLEFEELAYEPFSKFRRPYFYSVMHENKKPYLFYKIARNFWPFLIERKYSKEFLAFTIQIKYRKK
jgi:2-polyprenyl-3-methyl-5-hydroxy-6-metoxy-1,4-benzoquinol methylase